MIHVGKKQDVIKSYQEISDIGLRIIGYVCTVSREGRGENGETKKLRG